MSNFNFVPSPELVKIVQGDLDPLLPPIVRESMLDLILAWADLDMSTAFFVSTIAGLTPDEGANRYHRKVIADKLKIAATLLEAAGETETAQVVQNIGAEYPERALLRKRIAHSKCAGVRKSDNTQIVFLPFETEGPPGHLAMEIIALEAFVAQTQWARYAHLFFMNYVDAGNFFDQKIANESRNK